MLWRLLEAPLLSDLMAVKAWMQQLMWPLAGPPYDYGNGTAVVAQEVTAFYKAQVRGSAVWVSGGSDPTKV